MKPGDSCSKLLPGRLSEIEMFQQLGTTGLLRLGEGSNISSPEPNQDQSPDPLGRAVTLKFPIRSLRREVERFATGGFQYGVRFPAPRERTDHFPCVSRSQRPFRR